MGRVDLRPQFQRRVVTPMWLQASGSPGSPWTHRELRQSPRTPRASDYGIDLLTRSPGCPGSYSALPLDNLGAGQWTLTFGGRISYTAPSSRPLVPCLRTLDCASSESTSAQHLGVPAVSWEAAGPSFSTELSSVLGGSGQFKTEPESGSLPQECLRVPTVQLHAEMSSARPQPEVDEGSGQML